MSRAAQITILATFLILGLWYSINHFIDEYNDGGAIGTLVLRGMSYEQARQRVKEFRALNREMGLK